MSFAYVRGSICAALFLFGAELNSQTATPRPTPQSRPTAGVRDAAWKVLYEETFEDNAPLFKTGVPGWGPDMYQTTDEFSDGGAYFKRKGVIPPVRFRAEEPFGRAG